MQKAVAGAEGAVEHVQLPAVGTDGEDRLVVTIADVIPADVHDLAVHAHAGVAVVALVEGDLLDVAAVGIHHVQHQRRLTVVAVGVTEGRHAGRLQLRPAVGLAVGGEHDAAVGQVVRVEIIAGVGQLVVGDHAPQAAAVQGILPDVPGRVVRAAHGEDQPAAVVGDVGTAHVAPAAGVLVGDVVRRGAGRGQLAQVQVSAGNEGYAV